VNNTTANISYGKIMVMKRTNENSDKTIPLGMLIDSNGTPSQNADDALNGAMLPMSGYKGFGLGLAVELLSGPLIGAKGGRSAAESSDGLFIITIDPAPFTTQAKDNIESVLQEIKASRHAPEIKEILIPGEHSERHYNAHKNAPTIDIIEKTYNELKELSQA